MSPRSLRSGHGIIKQQFGGKCWKSSEWKLGKIPPQRPSPATAKTKVSLIVSLSQPRAPKLGGTLSGVLCEPVPSPSFLLPATPTHSMSLLCFPTCHPTTARARVRKLLSSKREESETVHIKGPWRFLNSKPGLTQGHHLSASEDEGSLSSLDHWASVIVKLSYAELKAVSLSLSLGGGGSDFGTSLKATDVKLFTFQKSMFLRTSLYFSGNLYITLVFLTLVFNNPCHFCISLR